MISGKISILCLIFGHNWDKYSGYDQLKVHPSAKCYRCNKIKGDTK